MIESKNKTYVAPVNRHWMINMHPIILPIIEHVQLVQLVVQKIHFFTSKVTKTLARYENNSVRQNRFESLFLIIFKALFCVLYLLQCRTCEIVNTFFLSTKGSAVSLSRPRLAVTHILIYTHTLTFPTFDLNDDKAMKGIKEEEKSA